MTAPSFAVRDWADAHPVESSLQIAIGPRGDADAVRGRCRQFTIELAHALGLSGATSWDVLTGDAASDRDRIVVTVRGRVRLVTPATSPADLLHMSGWARGLGVVETMAVNAVERVMLCDPSLLLDEAAMRDLVDALPLHHELRPDPAMLRALIARHVSLADRGSVANAFMLTEGVERTERLAVLTTLLHQTSWTVEVAHEQDITDGRADAVAKLASECLGGLGLALGEPQVRPERVFTRLLLGALPVLAAPSLDDVSVINAVRRVAHRLWDSASACALLDALARTSPDAVDVLRTRMSDDSFAAVIRTLAEELDVRDFPLLLDRLIEPVEVDVASLVEHARPDMVESHLALRRWLPFDLVTLARDEEAMVTRGLDDDGDLLRRFADRWADPVCTPSRYGHVMVALVDDPAARRPLWEHLAAQHPDVVVVQASEVPPWVAIDDARPLAALER